MFSQHKGQFLSLTSVVLNVGNKYDLESQFRAYMGLQDMSLSGKLNGIDPSNQRLLMQTDRSSIGVMKEYLQQMVASVVNDASSSGDSKSAAIAAAAQAELKKFDTMSTLEQKVYFNTVANSQDSSGSTPYTDVSQYRATLMALARSASSSDSSSSSSTSSTSSTGSTNSASGTSGTSGSDANTQTLAEIAATASGSSSSSGTVTDTVDLSPAAQRIIGSDSYTSGSSSTSAMSWNAGSNVSVTT